MRFAVFLLMLAVPLLTGADGDAERARAKLALIEDDKAAPGSVIVFTPPELNAWVRAELAEEPDTGIREPKLEMGDGVVSFEAMADFQKMAKAENAMFARLLEGERKVRIVAAPETSAGKVSVNLKLVEIGGVPLSGLLLDFAATLVLTRVYEDVQLDRPFEMGHNIDRAEITSSALRVFIKK